MSFLKEIKETDKIVNPNTGVPLKAVPRWANLYAAHAWSGHLLVARVLKLPFSKLINVAFTKKGIVNRIR